MNTPPLQPAPNDSAALPAPPCVAPDDVSPSGLAAFYRATIAPLRNYLSALLGNRDDAQDIAHDAYLKTFAAMAARTARKPDAVLFTAARNLAYSDRTRRANRLRPLDPKLLEEHSDPTPSGSDAASDTEMRGLLREAYKRLPVGCREALNLRYYEGLKVPEIAERMGISISGVEKYLIRGLKLLRAEMKRRAG